MSNWFLQRGYDVRFEWGLVGAQRLSANVECLVVVDVLSFTTSVTVAVERGTRIFPLAWGERRASAYARQIGAELAVGRRATTSTAPWSLSPSALRRAAFTDRLVLPSPNGSAIAAAAQGATVVAGCLRNASAVGRWLTNSGYGSPTRPVAVIAAGERWPDGDLRPALEDLLGAGAIIAALRTSGRATLSPEAAAAQASFTAADDVARALATCASGQELAEYGFADDVAIAGELDESNVVPVLHEAAFTDAGPDGGR